MDAFTKDGFQLLEHVSLPTDETVLASNIETREEVNILTGKKIHCIRYGSVLLVSSELMYQLRSK